MAINQWLSVADPGGPEVRAPPTPVKTSKNKDSRRAGPQVSRVSAPPWKNFWIRYWVVACEQSWSTEIESTSDQTKSRPFNLTTPTRLASSHKPQ